MKTVIMIDNNESGTCTATGGGGVVLRDGGLREQIKVNKRKWRSIISQDAGVTLAAFPAAQI